MLFRKLTYTDEQLVALLKGAEPDREAALRFIFVESGWRNLAFRAIRTMGGGVQDAEDAVQEAVIVLDDHVRGGKFQGTSTLKNYFIGICRGRWYSNRRSVQRLEWSDEPLPAQSAEDTDPESMLLENEQKTVFRELLSQIDERCRELLSLYKLAYSMDEIADTLGLGNANNARQRIHQCRQKLAKMIEHIPFFDDYRNRKK
ncbi:MAG: sigma-70 family RNA polymerase sigma factor [Saprospiraceae bacterium]|nr:sigma-70 family RNA polymerase sigma factor [Saprospiraceae bacterium]